MSSGSFWQVLHFSSQSHYDFCLRTNVRNAVREVFGNKTGCMLWSSCSIYAELSLIQGIYKVLTRDCLANKWSVIICQVKNKKLLVKKLSGRGCY